MPCGEGSSEICGAGNWLTLYIHNALVRPLAGNIFFYASCAFQQQCFRELLPFFLPYSLKRHDFNGVITSGKPSALIANSTTVSSTPTKDLSPTSSSLLSQGSSTSSPKVLRIQLGVRIYHLHLVQLCNIQIAVCSVDFGCIEFIICCFAGLCDGKVTTRTHQIPLKIS